MATNCPREAFAAPIPASAMPNGTSMPATISTSAASGSTVKTASATSTGPPIASAAAGIQRPKYPSSASMWSIASALRTPGDMRLVSAGPPENKPTNRAVRSRRRAAAPVSKPSRSMT